MMKYLTHLIFYSFLSSNICSIAYAKCSQSDQLQAYDCMEQQLKVDKVKMNKVYQRIYQQYDTQNKTLLEKSQKAWLNYREAQCTELTGSLYYGAMGLASGFAHLDCEMNATQYRLKELNRLVESQ
jgi:uncharacterized protein YecT (DUF1311 family)